VIGSKAELNGHQLTRVPSGFDKDHPRGELLRYRTLTASRDLGCPEWISTARAKTEIVKALRALSPLIDWLDLHVGRG
jgi:uncharacterized protein (DUF2461 family)